MKANNFIKKYLLLLARNRDPKAFAQIYDLYVDQIYRFIYFKIYEKDEAQDLTSEVFLKAWQYISEGNVVENLNALFYQIARNLVIDYYREKKNREMLVENEADFESIEAVDDSQLTKIELKIEADKVVDQLINLKDEYKEVVILRYVENFSVKEIAEIVGKKKGNVRIILFRALSALKDLMGEKNE